MTNGLRTRSIKGATGIPRGFAGGMSEKCLDSGGVGGCTLGTAVAMSDLFARTDTLLTSRLWLHQPLYLDLYISTSFALFAFIQGFASRRKCPAMSVLGGRASSSHVLRLSRLQTLSAPPRHSLSSAVPPNLAS
ncbi:hypothetical protein IG631_01120 [Alternaria alternata]|nr:hypothetical protein IG631_01120 [Alternaria alternata]